MRCKFTEDELLAQDMHENSGDFHFLYDPENETSSHDFYLHEDFVRLVLCADEGTEAQSWLFLRVFLPCICPAPGLSRVAAPRVAGELVCFLG